MKGMAALNVYKKVAVIRSGTDTLHYEDVDGTVKTVTDLGVAASTATPALLASHAKNDIPVPQIKTVETYEKDVPNNYKIKSSFVRYHRPSRAEWRQAIEYIADAEDEAWLTGNTKFGGTLHSLGEAGATADSASTVTQQSQLPLETFEHMMDLLEKATGFDVILTSNQAEQLINEKIPSIFQMFPARGKAGVVTTKHVINDVYNYWIQKRSKLKRPLLRRFWPVTSTDDTNPHLVFRPREKEKYKLRKTRRNDMLSFNKMKQLRNDFENLRLILDLVRKREELHRAQLLMQCENFEQKLFDITDTSGKPRLSDTLKKRDLDQVLIVPTHFDVHLGPGKKGKRGRKVGSRSVSPAPHFDKPEVVTAAVAATPSTSATVPDTVHRIVAGQNFGQPAPNFLQPLATREFYVNSWDHAVPHFTSYIEAHALPTYRFKHRPRIGRGGRVIIDRLPCPPHPAITPTTFFTAGKGLPRQVPGSQNKTSLLDLLPQPLDHQVVSRRIEELSLAALQEDFDIATGALGPTGSPLDGEENDGTEVLVKLEDWLETDEQLWGEERYAIGPV